MTDMRYFRLIVLLSILYLIQTVIISRFAAFGVKADILLVVTTMFAVNFGAEKGFIVGFLGGIIQDLFGVSYFFHSMTRAILGFLVGTFKESIVGSEEGIAFTSVIVATVANFMIELLFFFFFFGKPVASPLILLETLFVSCIYNALFVPVLYPLIKWSSARLVRE